jgi:hypothetical protein
VDIGFITLFVASEDETVMWRRARIVCFQFLFKRFYGKVRRNHSQRPVKEFSVIFSQFS